jgi:hypothetical protein
MNYMNMNMTRDACGGRWPLVVCRRVPSGRVDALTTPCPCHVALPSSPPRARATCQDSSTHEAGVREYDVLVGVNGYKVTNQSQLLALLPALPPSGTVTLAVVRVTDNRKDATPRDPTLTPHGTPPSWCVAGARHGQPQGRLVWRRGCVAGACP